MRLTTTSSTSLCWESSCSRAARISAVDAFAKGECVS
jgi:hypothetical protein